MTAKPGTSRRKTGWKQEKVANIMENLGEIQAFFGKMKKTQ